MFRFPMLTTTYTGRDDIIEFSDGRTTFQASFFELGHQLKRIANILPPPCPECEGCGDLVLDERDIVPCGVCKGRRVVGAPGSSG
jgi:hypothetical protein